VLVGALATCPECRRYGTIAGVVVVTCVAAYLLILAKDSDKSGQAAPSKPSKAK
jgi:hypothetical protein